MSFRANSGITLKTNVSGNEEQRVEYGGEVLDSGNAVPYIRTVNANTGEEIDRYFLINDSLLYYDGTKLVSTRPFMVQGDFYLPNNGKIFAPDSTGNEREVMNAASGDNFSLGYGNYANSRGNTTLYGNDITLAARGTVSTGNTLILSKTADASPTADNGPALIVGPRTGLHLELDQNEIIAKATANTGSHLYLGDQAAGETIMSGTYLRLNPKNKITVNGNPLFKTNTCTSPTATLNAGVGTTKTANITTISGYTPIGIIEATCNHGQICSMGAFWLSGNTANGSWTNRSGSSTSLNASFRILHIRSELL